MHGHQLQGVVALARLMLAGLQRGVGKKGDEFGRQFALFAHHSGFGEEVGRGIDQFVEIGQALLAFLFIPVMRTQAGDLDDMLDQLGQRQMRGLAQRDDQLRKGGQRGAGLAGKLRNRRAQAGLRRPGRVLQQLQAARADAAGGEIDHPGEGGVVVGIGDQAQIGQRVLDFGALEKAQPAIHPIRQAGAEQRVLKRARLRVAAIEQRNLGAGMTIAGQRADFLDNEARLVAIGPGFMHANRLATAGFGPQVLAQPRGIVLDDGIGGVEDIAVRAVVLLQPDQVRHFELALEIAHVADVGAAKAVDGLVVVADGKHRRACAGQ